MTCSARFFVALLAALLSPASRADRAALQAARVVPAGVDAALLLDGASALAGFRAFLTTAGRLAPLVQPSEVGGYLRAGVGVDLLAASEAQGWGLAEGGPRAVVAQGRTVGASLPLTSPDATRKALEEWLAEAGKPRPAQVGGVSLRVAGGGRRVRAGAVARVAGTSRLVLASGAEAPKLVAALAGVGRTRRALSKKADVAAEIRAAQGPVVLYAAGETPLRAAVLSLSGTPDALSADGVLLALPGQALLAGPPAAAAACEGPHLFCARAGLGTGGKAAIATLLRQWSVQALPRAEAQKLWALLAPLTQSMTGPFALRLAGLDLKELGAVSPPWTVPFTAAFLQSGFRVPGGALSLRGERSFCARSDAFSASLGDDCQAAPPPLSPAPGETDSVASVDVPGMARTLQHASPLMALRGSLPAGAYTAHLLFGRLLDASGPITARARPLARPAGAARLELRWALTAR